MHSWIIPNGPQQILRKLLSGLVLSVALPFFVNGQARQQWHIVKQLPARTERAFYIDRGPDSDEPDTISRSPILEAIFFVDSLNGWAISDRGHIVRTKNGGQTWIARKINLPLYLNGLFFISKWDGWLIGNGKGGAVILRTKDGGKTWHTQSKIEGFDLVAVHDISFADERHGWAIGEAQKEGVVQGVILATQDGGIHWQPQYLAKERSSMLNAIKFADLRRGWAVGHNVILHTENGGQQWHEQRYSQGEYLFDVDFTSPTDGWAVGSDGLVLHTANGGSTWYPRQLPVKYQNLWLASVKFINPIWGWIVGDNGAIFSTNDSGQTWKLESIGRSEYLRDLASTSRSIFAVGNNGVILRRQI